MIHGTFSVDSLGFYSEHDLKRLESSWNVSRNPSTDAFFSSNPVLQSVIYTSSVARPFQEASEVISAKCMVKIPVDAYFQP